MGEGTVKVDLPFGEVADRITICRIKTRRLTSPTKRSAASDWLQTLVAAWSASGLPDLDDLPEVAALEQLNGELWEVEDALRAAEVRGDFGPGFIALARSVYRLNDRRAALKTELDNRLGSPLTDVKGHI